MEHPHITSESLGNAPEEELLDIDEQPELEDSAEATHHKFGEAIMKTLAPTPEEGSDSTPDSSEKKSKGAKEGEQLSPEQLQAYRKAESFIKRYGMSMSVFSRDSSLSFKIEPGARTFAFDAADFSVITPVEWFNAEKYSEDEILFANLHERGHFIDMMADPDAYLECFERMGKIAEQQADLYIKSHPEASSRRNALISYIRTELHTLYNCLDDIFVNDLVVGRYKGFSARQAPIVSLYKKLGFGDADLTKAPLQRQLCYALLRDAMIAGKTDPETGKKIEPSIVDPQVQEKLDEKHGLLPKISGIIDSFMRPTKDGRMITRSSQNHRNEQKANGPRYRHNLIEKYIEPAFFELIQPALDKLVNQPEPEPQNGGEGGEGNPSNGETADSPTSTGEMGDSPNTPQESNGDEESGEPEGATKGGDGGKEGDSGSEGGSSAESGKGGKKGNEFFDQEIDEESLKKILEAMKDAKKRGKDKVQEEARKAKWDREHNVTPLQRQRYDRAMANMSEARREMLEVWRDIVGTSIQYRRVMRNGQTKGAIDIRSIIRHYPAFVKAVQSGNFDDLAVYRRRVLEKETTPQAERIEVSLVVDCSGSMGTMNGYGPEEIDEHGNKKRTGSREEAAREAVALLLTSLGDFNNDLAYAGSDLRADTEVLLFGSSFDYSNPEDVPKTFANGRPSSDVQGEIVRCVGSVNSEHDGTEDSLPIASIAERLTDEQREALKSKKLRKIVFEITDGDTFHPDVTRALVKKLADEGVIMICIYIGDDSSSEREKIAERWKPAPDKPDQMIRFVHGKASELPGILMRELQAILATEAI